ncbi:MAG: ABC transporter ATP-binding protein, partial [Minicystis sp.]
YLYLSKMMVSGTPEMLKALPIVNKPGTRRIELESSQPARALAWLGTQEFAVSATIFGQAVHSVVNGRMGDDELMARMREAGFSGLGVRDIAPTLEDVFVTLTEDAARERGEAGAPASSKA